MGVRITDREYANGYKPELVNWLLGNTGDWLRGTFELEFSVLKEFGLGNMLLIDGFDFVLTDGTQWGDYGFKEGDAITFQFRARTYGTDGSLISETVTTYNRNVLSIVADRMKYNGAQIQDVYTDTYPYISGTVKYEKVIIYSDTKPEGVEVYYGHTTNEDYDSGNINSFIDGTLGKMENQNTGTMPALTPEAMTPSGFQSGMSVHSANIQFINSINGVHVYEVEVEFMISSFMETLENFETLTPPSQVIDTNSVTDNMQVVGFPVWNNPNVRMANNLQDTKILGNTGWFNENFNGKPDNLELKSVEYFDEATGDPVEKLNYNSPTRVKAVIGGVKNLQVGLTTCGLGFIWVSGNGEYINEKTTPYHQNARVNTAGAYGVGLFPVSASPSPSTYQGFSPDGTSRIDVNEVHFYEDGTDLVYEAVWIPTQGFIDLMNTVNINERNYAIWVSVADYVPATSFTDRVNKLIDYNQFDELVEPAGEWDNLDCEIYTHPETDEPEEIHIDQEFFKEDDLLARFNMKLGSVLDPPCKQGFAMYGLNQNEVQIEGGFINTFNNQGVNSKITFSNGDGVTEVNVLISSMPDFEFTDMTIGDDYMIKFTVDSIGKSDLIEVRIGTGENWVRVPNDGVGEYCVITPYFIGGNGTVPMFRFTGNGILSDVMIGKKTCCQAYNFEKPIGLKFAVEAKKTTGEKDELESYSIDLSTQPEDANGVPQWDVNETRGFKLEDGNNKNWVKAIRDEGNDETGLFAYRLYYAFRIRWEDWLKRLGANNAFFNAAIKQNGLNNDWFHVFNTAGWSVVLTLYTDVEEDGEVKRYTNEKTISLLDYHSNPDVGETWNYYRDSNDTSLNNGIDSETGNTLGVIVDEPVRVEVIYENLAGTWTDITDFYGTICVEVWEGTGLFDFRQLSTVWGSEPDNPLKPLAGETKCKITLVDTTHIKLECLVMPDLLIEASKYKFSSRLGNKDDILDNGCLLTQDEENLLSSNEECLKPS